VLLSNSGGPAVRDLYREGFRVEEVMASRAINSRADRRGPVAELLIS
jgi:DNA adenine methylase